MNVDGRKLLSLHGIPFFIRIVITLVILNIRKRRLYLLAGHQLKARDELKTAAGTEITYWSNDNHTVKGTS